MANVYAPNVAQFNLNFTYQDEPAQNTLYFLYTTEPTTSNLNTTATLIYNIWANNAAPFAPSTVRLNEVKAMSLDSPGAPVGGYTPSTPSTGADLGASAPNQDTISVSFRTGFAGRSRRGRNYWIGLLKANITNNRLDPAVMGAIIDYYNEFLPSSGIFTNCVWGVYSRFANKTPRLIGLFTPINQVLFVNNVIDSQRNRMPE